VGAADAKDGNEDETKTARPSVGRAAPSIRLRFSVSFFSDRARMLGYLTSKTEDADHHLCFDSNSSAVAASHHKGAKFALFGPDEMLGEYKYKVTPAALSPPNPSPPCLTLPPPPPGADGAHGRSVRLPGVV
jgi:hypothetical protein